MANAHDPDERLLAAYIGPQWERYYRARFAHFRAYPWRPIAWNWAAALVPFWPVYRNVGAAFLIYILAAIGLLVVSSVVSASVTNAVLYVSLSIVTVGAACGFLEGLLGTWLLYRQARTMVARARRRTGPEVAALHLLERSRPAASVQGIVGLVLGSALLLVLAVVLASVVPRMSTAYDKAYGAAMRSDLRNVVTAQEAARRAQGAYAASVAALGGGFRASTAVTVRITVADSTGFAAVAIHEWTALRCAVFVGTAQPPRAEMVEGEPACVRGTP